MADDSRRLRQDLCKLFTKFKKKELHQGLIERGILQEDYPDTEGSKKSFVSRILDSCYHGEVTKDQVALMDLLYHQTYPNCKKWIVYKLEGFEPGKKLNISDPWKFKSKLKSSLEHYFKVDIFVHLWKNSLWTRLHFCEGSSSSLLSNTVYIIYYPNAQYIFMSSIKAAYKQYILQALSSLLHCQALEEINLSGRDVFSLKELLLNKSSQGAFSKYKLNQIDMNPLSRKRKREIDANMKPLNQEITNENKEEELKRHQIADNAFGPNPQPVLERVEFKMRTRLRSGSQDFPQLNNQISCSVKFEGTSVIEGIKNLGAQTFVSVPLPSYLANLHSLARNTFSLTEKKKADNEEGCT